MNPFTRLLDRPNGKILLSVVLSLILGSCGQPTEEYHANPNAYLVDQLAGKRIVMLGDFYHSAPLPYHTLTSLLNEWVNEAVAGKTMDTSVVLVLEDGSATVDSLKSFISTGDWQPLLKYWLPYNTMESLEFCADLRELSLRIDSLDSLPDVKHGIHFDIIGGEDFASLGNPSFLRLSREQGVRYFVNVRDSLTALNISAYLDSCRNSKAIVFYGTNHLVGNYVHKDVAGSLPWLQTGGYYLAHYLKEAFGADSVLTVCQISPYRLSKSLPFFHTALDSDIFFPSDGVTSKDVDLPGLEPGAFDGFITRRELIIPGHPLADVFGREVVQADVNRMLFFKGFLPGAAAKRYYDGALNSLQLITGRDFKDAVEWKRFAETGRYDGFARIESRALADQMFHEFYNDTRSMRTREQLYNLGLRMPILGGGWTPTESYWRETLWPDAVEDIKTNTSIGLLWVGTPQEKKEAAGYLVKTFGKPLKQPQEYLKLLRHRLYNVGY